MPEIFSPFAVLTGADPLVQAVLFVLLAVSVLTWVVIFERWIYLGGAARDNTWFSDEFWSGRDLLELYEEVKGSPQRGVAALFVQAVREYLRLHAQGADRGQVLEGVQRMLRVSLVREERDLARHLPLLAVIGSTSPYLGLFGTVWGIIDSFQGISGAAQATLTALAPGIAEALIATALGLFAAIPAVVAHNTLGAFVGRQGGEMEDFAEDLLAVIERQLPAQQGGG